MLLQQCCSSGLISVKGNILFLIKSISTHLILYLNWVLTFFNRLYEKTCQYSSVNLARNALASVITLRGYVTISNHLLPSTITKTKILFYLGYRYITEELDTYRDNS